MEMEGLRLPSAVVKGNTRVNRPRAKRHISEQSIKTQTFSLALEHGSGLQLRLLAESIQVLFEKESARRK